MSKQPPPQYCEDPSLPGLFFCDLPSLENAKLLAREEPGNYLITGGPISGKTHLVRTLFPGARMYRFPRRFKADAFVWREVEEAGILCYDDVDFYWWKPAQWNGLKQWLTAERWLYRPKRSRDVVEIKLPKVRIITSTKPLNAFPHDVLRRFHVIAPTPGKLPDHWTDGKEAP